MSSSSTHCGVPRGTLPHRDSLLTKWVGDGVDRWIHKVRARVTAGSMVPDPLLVPTRRESLSRTSPGHTPGHSTGSCDSRSGVTPRVVPPHGKGDVRRRGDRVRGEVQMTVLDGGDTSL